MTTILTHHHLTAEAIHDKHGDAIMLTQSEDGFNEPNTVVLHPWQLRAVCEQFGIIASDPQAAKTIATLQRRMLGLHERIRALFDWMAEHSDHKHADLTYETTQLLALLDLANEWVADFEDEDTEGAPLHCSSVRNSLQPSTGFADMPTSTDQPSLI
ncbi:MAG: hypothetical protein Q8S02_08685 [Hydrogenophaga sp.]|nr:hypothetical protein [Hydrogenophaga sp.]